MCLCPCSSQTSMSNQPAPCSAPALPPLPLQTMLKLSAGEDRLLVKFELYSCRIPQDVQSLQSYFYQTIFALTDKYNKRLSHLRPPQTEQELVIWFDVQCQKLMSVVENKLDFCLFKFQVLRDPPPSECVSSNTEMLSALELCDHDDNPIDLSLDRDAQHIRILPRGTNEPINALFKSMPSYAPMERQTFAENLRNTYNPHQPCPRNQVLMNPVCPVRTAFVPIRPKPPMPAMQLPGDIPIRSKPPLPAMQLPGDMPICPKPPLPAMQLPGDVPLTFLPSCAIPSGHPIPAMMTEMLTVPPCVALPAASSYLTYEMQMHHFVSRL